MTDDLERLEALAMECMKPHGYMTGEDFIAAANPATILSLIQRVREAERLLKIENGIRALAQQNFENMKQYSEDAYDNGRKAGHAAGRAEALEEAAATLDKRSKIQADDDYSIGHSDGSRSGAAAIRALGEKAG